MQNSGIKIPLIKNNELKSYVPKISKNNLILITLPTPKQEILAYEITKKNKNFKIICTWWWIKYCHR